MDFLTYVGLIFVAFALWSISNALKELKKEPEDITVVYFQFPSIVKAIEELNLAIGNLGGTQKCRFNDDKVLELYCPRDIESKEKPYYTSENSCIDGFSEGGQIILTLGLDDDCLLLLLSELKKSNRFTEANLVKEVEPYYIYDPHRI